jgi:hypothetical protein
MEIHSFQVDIATKYGIAEAILLGYFYHWIKVHEKNETNFYDERYWTYDSERTLVDKMPYIPKTTMHRLIKKLVDSGLLLTGNYNKFSYDKTKWFSLSDKAMMLFVGQEGCPKMDHHLVQNGPTIPTYNEESKNELPQNGPPPVQNGPTIPIQSTYSLNRERDKGKPAAENFPGSKYSDEVYDKARSAYERFIGPIPNSGIKEGILSCVDDYGLDDFINVVKLAARNNAYSFAYIETVLRNQTKRKEGEKNEKNKKSDTTKAGRPKVSQYI